MGVERIIEIFYPTQAQAWLYGHRNKINIKDRTHNDKSNRFDFQKDADICTFKPFDPARPFHSLIFHLKSCSWQRNDGKLLNIEMHPNQTRSSFLFRLDMNIENPVL